MGQIGYYAYKRENEDTGAAKYYVRPAKYSVIGKEEATLYAMKITNMNRSDMAMGFAALNQAINEFVLNGHSVTLDGVGTFTLSSRTGIWDDKAQKWTSAGKTSMDDVSSRDIKGVYLRFRPCTELRKMLKQTNFVYVPTQSFGAKNGWEDFRKKS